MNGRNRILPLKMTEKMSRIIYTLEFTSEFIEAIRKKINLQKPISIH